MTRNRESVLLTTSLRAAQQIGLAMAVLPPDQHHHAHAALSDALQSALIMAEEIRQEWSTKP